MDGRALLLLMLVSTSALAEDLDDLIEVAAREHRLPPALVHAVVEVESAYRPEAVSPKGAMGLMQLMPGTARSLDIQHPFEPAENLSGGCRYLRRLWDRFGDLELALAAYNAGPGAVELAGGVPRFPETRQYVAHVLENFRQIAGVEPSGKLLPVSATSVSSGILVPLQADEEQTSLVAWGPR